MVIQILLLALLFAIAYEDFRYREVHVYWFFFLFLGLIWQSLQQETIIETIYKLSVNLFFCVVQFAVLNIYFCIKTQKWAWIFDRYLGWGDVVFLLCITPVWNLSGFIFYVISSLFISLLIYVLVIRTKSKKIPLAGLQSLYLAFLLAIEWFWSFSLDYEIYKYLKI